MEFNITVKLDFIKIFFRGTIFLFLAYLALLPIWNYMNYGKPILGPNKTSQCGVIIDKRDPATGYTHKSNTTVRYEPMFIIKFDEPIGIKEIMPSWHDFYGHEKGDKICYKLDDEINSPSFFEIMVDVIGCIILIMGAFALFVIFLSWVFDWD